jgi:hypothetical protein
MAITHVRFVHSNIPPDWESRTFEDLEKDRHVLLVDMVPEGTEMKPGQMYRELDPAIKGTDCVVLRGAWPHIKNAILRDPGLRGEVGDRPTMALVGGTRPDRTGPDLVELPGFRPIDQPLNMESLRQVELEALLDRTGAIFADDSSHYGLPSTYHAEKFIRLADALRSLHDVSRVVDWVMEYVTSETVVIADTGSLLPLLYHLREEAARRFRWKVEIASIDQYPNDNLGLINAVDAIKNRPEIAWRFASVAPPRPRPVRWQDRLADLWHHIVRRAKEEFEALKGGRRTKPRGALVPGVPPRFLFLVSVSSTGRLCKLFRELEIPEPDVLVVCETKPNPKPPCENHLVWVPINRWEVGSDGKCEHCQDQGKRIIRVDPVSYELIPPVYEPRQLPMSKDRAEAQRNFWKVACEQKAVSLHHTADYSGSEKNRARHFSVYLDTLRLAEHGGFRQLCKEQLQQTKPDVILIPSHTHSDMVRRLCFEAYQKELPCFLVTSGKLQGAVVDHLGRADRVLVADDAIVTGTTLVNLRAEVFRTTQLLGREPEVNAFVLVCRPATKEPIKDIRRIYSGQAIRELLKGVELFLPRGQNCPWCEEERLLGRFADRLQGKALERAKVRLDKLRSGPIKPPLLMVKNEDAHDGLITHGSLFGNLDHVTAFAAGSCASQTLKLELGTNGGVQLAIVEVAMAVGAYYEGPLLASMLRTFDRIDARYLGVDPTIEAKIEGINPQQAYPGTLADLALAALTGKVPGGKLRALLEREKANDEWLQMLADLYDIIKPI